METLKEEWRVAKKDHVCDLCYESIHTGEKYNYAFIKDGNNAYGFKCHANCYYILDQLWDWFDPYNDISGISHYEFEDLLYEYCNEYVCPYCVECDGKPGIPCINKIWQSIVLQNGWIADSNK